MEEYNQNIKSLSEFIEHYKRRLGKKFKDSKIRLYFRGESMDYGINSLVPKIYRTGTDGKFLYNEYQEYYKYLRRCPEEFTGMSNIDILSKMQHDGAPTRLLDLTTNPLVALFFACNSNFDKDGILYVFFGEKDDNDKKKKGNILSFDSDRALMMSTIPKLTVTEQIEVHQYCQNIIKKNLENPNKAELRLDNEYLMINKSHAVSRFIYECERERTAFQNHSIDVLDLYRMSYVKPRFTNDRIKKQSGLFGIFGFGDYGLYTTDFRFYIDSESKKKILAELLFIAGIDHYSLFGGIEGLAKDNKDELYSVFVNSLEDVNKLD